MRLANASKFEIAATPRISVGEVLGCAWPALILATACLLPYLSKPFVIDDPYFLAMARQILGHPKHPMDFTVCWNIVPNCAKAYLLTPGNTLMGYVLVPTILTGAHEWVAHLTQLALAWTAAIAMTSLVFRFGWNPAHAIAGSLFLVAIPPFLPMASTAMPDILSTAVTLLGMERLAAWKVERRWTQGVVAAIALGLAGLARANLALLLPLAAFYLFNNMEPKKAFEQIRQKFWLWSPVLAGCGVLAAIILTVREHNLALDPPPIAVGWGKIPHNVLSYMSYLSFPLPLAICWSANRLKAGKIRSLIALFAVAASLGFSILDLYLALFLASFGLGALGSLLIEAWKKRDHERLFLILWIVIPLPIAGYLHLPMKYLLPSIPAVILLCFRLMEGFAPSAKRVAAICLIVFCAGYSLLILRSDAEFAEFGRDSMYRLISPHAKAGERVWYNGQYWSYWYAPLAGATATYQSGPQPKPGDLLVVDVLAGGSQALAPFPHRTLVDATTHKYRFGRTMGAGAGLYSNSFGFWLWGFGTSPADRYELWRID